MNIELSNYVINNKGQLTYSYFFQELNKWLEREKDYREGILKGADRLFEELKKRNGQTKNLQ